MSATRTVNSNSNSNDSERQDLNLASNMTTFLKLTFFLHMSFGELITSMHI